MSKILTKNLLAGRQEYKLEDIQMKTFDGLQAILAVPTTAMFVIYKKMQPLHFGLLLDAGYNYLNKHTVRELTNFIYYKISKVAPILLMPTRSRWKVTEMPPGDNLGQLNLMLNSNNHFTNLQKTSKSWIRSK